MREKNVCREKSLWSLRGSKKKTKSCVCNEFGLRSTDDGKVIENEKNSPLCLTCGKSVQAKGSTMNLWQHLREHHPSVYAKISSHKAAKNPGECSTQLTLEESASKGTKYNRGRLLPENLSKLVFLAKNM